MRKGLERSKMAIGLKATSQWSRKKLKNKENWTIGQIWQGQHANHKDSNIKYNVCYEEAVVEMNIHVGDDDAGVENSLKKNKKWEATKRRESTHREVLGRELGLGL
jgi:predicted transcriptional regulator YdeE